MEFAPLGDSLRNRINHLSGKTVRDFTVATRGYTPALRGRIRFSDDTTAFVKIGTTDLTADWLHDEIRLYRACENRFSFLPRFIAAENHETAPLLLIEDLGDAHWPPVWKAGQVEAFIETLGQVHCIGNTLPVALTCLPRLHAHYNQSWRRVAQNPQTFLSLGYCSASWLHAALPTLLAAEASTDVSGDNLLHMDTRSDNLCFAGKEESRVVLVDWNHACIGNGLMDIAFWLPSLHSESGILPERILPDSANWAAAVSGFFAARAGQPAIANAPHVRTVQKSQLRSALPWAARMLGLPPLSIPE